MRAANSIIQRAAANKRACRGTAESVRRTKVRAGRYGALVTKRGRSFLRARRRLSGKPEARNPKRPTYVPLRRTSHSRVVSFPRPREHGRARRGDLSPFSVLRLPEPLTNRGADTSASRRALSASSALGRGFRRERVYPGVEARGSAGYIDGINRIAIRVQGACHPNAPRGLVERCPRSHPSSAARSHGRPDGERRIGLPSAKKALPLVRLV